MFTYNSNMDRRLAFLLNSCASGNLPAEDQNELSGLITDYFIDGDTDPDWSEDDSDREDEEEIGVDSTDFDTDGDAEIDDPLVHVATVHGDADCIGDRMDFDHAPLDDGGMYARAQGRSCKPNGQGCTQIKVPSPAPDERRSGCITQFSPEEIVALQLSVKDMDRESQDMMILGVLSSCMRNGPKTECSKWKAQRDLFKPRSSYCLLTRPVCKYTFLFLLGISQDKLTRLHKHYQEEGLTPLRRKTGGRKNNTKSLSLDDTGRVVRFLNNYAEDHAVSLPGRVPGFKRDIRLLPSSHPKSRIYRLYVDHADQNGYRKVAKSTFGRLWKELCPFIVVARPMTDLCWRCQKNNTNIYRSANLTMDEKAELLLEQQQHLSQVDGERQLYRQMSAAAKVTRQQQALQQLQPSTANSGGFAMHYSFDYAQQVHYPSDAAQPEPLYFLTPRKCGIFGVHCEGLSKQINFLIDEAVTAGKGSNAVISYLHFFFQNFGLGEKILHLHCDNCAGQNKNRFMLFYFAWRVQSGLHSEVTINFMPPGHTKFAPDWCFGLLKRCFRRSHVSCLADLENVVKESTAVSQTNIPQLVGKEDGTVLVKTYDWQTFFLQAGYKTFTGIKPIGHFRFSSQHPGQLFYKTTIPDEETAVTLATADQFMQLPAMPAEQHPPGLPAARQRYLFERIREFVRDDQRDVVCPQPRP